MTEDNRPQDCDLESYKQLAKIREIFGLEKEPLESLADAIKEKRQAWELFRQGEVCELADQIIALKAEIEKLKEPTYYAHYDSAYDGETYGDLDGLMDYHDGGEIVKVCQYRELGEIYAIKLHPNGDGLQEPIIKTFPAKEEALAALKEQEE